MCGFFRKRPVLGSKRRRMRLPGNSRYEVLFVRFEFLLLEVVDCFLL
jgi:hypothetical protein